MTKNACTASVCTRVAYRASIEPALTSKVNGHGPGKSRPRER